jgi:hypothetical protein
MPNRLAEETSPYLLQHADNPVDWWAWGPAALAAARSANKPILLSVGYAACHWCHVMAHESFEDPAIAAVMNDLFVNIKVDREERPDIDTIYQSALAMLGQHGGWPLTMFLTPDGDPFWGGTYFPKEPRFGRPGFADVLRAIAGTWTDEPDKVDKNVTALRGGLAKLADNRRDDPIAPEVLEEVAGRLVGEIDPRWGGVGRAPKFPQPSILTLLWRAYTRTGEDRYRQAVVLTLTRMCQGGIYDHLGGGFARYSTDDEWLAPHFEKMLYDNAQLLQVLTLVWQETRSPLFERRVRETVDWLLDEMIAESGAFASTLDADSEGEEGRYYVWRPEDIDRLLGEDAPLFREVFDVTTGGNWEGVTILNRRHEDSLRDGTTEATLDRDRAILKAERDSRIRPGWDDKVLADWNGLTIQALAEAGQVFQQPAWIAAATRAFDAVVATHEAPDGDHGVRLHHAWRAGRVTAPGMLDDHAAMAGAALALFETTAEHRFLDKAIAWAEACERHFRDAAGGGYFLTADDAETLIVRTKTVYDNATPAGNGLLLGVFARLFHLTGDMRWLERAEGLIAAFAGELQRNFFPLSTWLNNVELLHRAVQVVIIGPADAAVTESLVRAALDRSLPNRILIRLDPDTALPEGHPAAGKTAIDGRPTAYVCAGMTCKPPITDPNALADALEI